MYQPNSLPPHKSLWIVIAILLSLFSSGCGSSSKSSQSISPAQAQAISQEIITALQGALTSASGGLSVPREAHPSLPAAMHEANPAQSQDCITNANGEICNLPMSYTGPCPGGGSITVSGDFDVTLDNSGNGADSTAITVTPTNCSVSNLTINGDPDVLVVTQLNIANYQVVFPMTLTGAGGISYGPNPHGSCIMDVTLTIGSQTSCTVSGNLCGQPLSGSC